MYRCRAQFSSRDRVTNNMHRTDRAIVSQLERLQPSASKRLPVCVPETLVAKLLTTSAELITAAEQYGTEKNTHEMFLRQRLRSTSIIAKADTDLRRYLRVGSSGSIQTPPRPSTP